MRDSIIGKELFQDFNTDNKALGKTCKQYYDMRVKEEPDLREDWTDSEISDLIIGCDNERKKFEMRMNKLLEIYKKTPLELKLRKIDKTIIIGELYQVKC